MGDARFMVSNDRYFNRPYTDYLDGYFDMSKTQAGGNPMVLAVLRYGNLGQTYVAPNQGHVVMVDAQGRYLGDATGYANRQNNKFMHAGIVVQYTDFLRQYNPTKAGVKYEF